MASGSGAAPAAAPVDTAALTPAQLAGQRIVYAFEGTAPPPALVRRIRRGEAGAVILFASNAPTNAAARTLVRRLQAIPRPRAVDRPLLVMVDQEGGPVRRLAGPPAQSGAQLGAAGPTVARAAGRAAGRLLRSVGANVDLAPVADVGRPGSALLGERRIAGTSAATVTGVTVAFSTGLAQAGVAAAPKHFPGFGAATVNTDAAPARITVPAAELRRVDMRPFRALIDRGVPMVMLSTAIYTALDPSHPAALSRRIATGELRGRLGFRGVSVSDDLDTPALAESGGTVTVALTAARAGTDMLIFVGQASGPRAADGMAAALASGALPRAAAEASVARIMALRAALPPGLPSSRP
jgi:beta-N-acetylhexosaminidase